MFDRMSMWVGAGVVAAGMSAAVLTGAGMAIAATEPATGGETSTSESTSESTKAESSEQGDAPTDPGTDDTDTDDTDDTDTKDEDENQDGDVDLGDTDDVDDTETDPAPETDDEDATDGSDSDSSAQPDVASPELTQPATPSAEPAAEVTEESGDPEPVAESVASTPETAVTEPEAAATTRPTPAVTRLAAVSAVDPEPAATATAPRQTLLSLVGTIVFNLYSVAIRVFGGPPLLPRGSTVTVHSSRVDIDCGDGYEVPANWFVPEGPTPTRLIYLQHGFLAAGPFYSYTAARLAEATHSIVVTTSLTSNFLACDGCWVGGSPMHKAVADLFVDGNTALADSALAAGYSATLLDGVEKVVLMGHSAGGGLAAGTAGYMVGNGAIDRLAGVVMLDGVGFGDVMPEALAKLPDDVPIYNLAGKAYYWNMSGAAGEALEAERSGMFTGVRLVGGLHSDMMMGGNPLIQAGLYLVTGWSRAENVKASEILSASWVNDMFAGTQASPYYGAAGTLLEIETARGTATAYVMPGPPQRLRFVDKVFQFFSNIVFGIDFATCVAPSAEISTLSAPNTLLSLDGRTKPGQSIAQQCMQG
ncbi:MAG: hypothetical protein U1D00_26115 [Mycobacterium sp.]|nr:hypothetical protein [Mycobacterium sp.]